MNDNINITDNISHYMNKENDWFKVGVSVGGLAVFGLILYGVKVVFG